jgi:hypothetical protein
MWRFRNATQADGLRILGFIGVDLRASAAHLGFWFSRSAGRRSDLAAADDARTQSERARRRGS